MDLNRNKAPLKCWDIYAMHLIKHTNKFDTVADLTTLNAFKEKNNWVLDFNALILPKQFDAIVITDINRVIQWVSKGFTKMTGYPANFAKGKKPLFLQGEETTTVSKSNISKNLQDLNITKQSVINYKKSGRVYKCDIEIYPLRNTQNQVTHFMALEKEVEYLN